MLTKSRLLTALSNRRPGYLGWRIGVGSAALVCWLAIFCGGLLIDTTQYRAHLAPRQFAKLAQDEAAAIPKFEGSSLTAFLLSALWFTPTNLAFLALLSGLLGGCVSNILVADPVKSQRIDPQRYSYLAEMPWSSMIRSFIVYLCVIAGLYFAMDDPFKDPTPSQYMRLAGTISLLALLVGYDPSRIFYWMGLAQTSRTE